MDRATFIKHYFNFCSEVGERPENVLVSAGGALLMLGLRETTSDLDLDVRGEVYDLYRNKDNVRQNSISEYVDYSEVISLHEMSLFADKQEIEGVWVYGIQELMDQKVSLSEMPDRKLEKVVNDLRDIEMLRAL